MAWTYNQPGVKYNKFNIAYNSIMAKVKVYYTGGMSAAKRMLRGFGF